MIIRRIPGIHSVLTGIFLCCFFLSGNPVFPQDSVSQKEPGYLVVSGGLYSCLDLWASTGFVNFQVQPGCKFWVLRPQGGVLVTFSGACMVYGGVIYPAMPVKWLVIQTGFALGYYESGKGIRLGFPLEFRISLSILYRFRNYSQLGMEFAHISNGDLSGHNPGTESLSLIFQFPVRKRKAYE
jgi:hypothetical protein